MDLEHAHQNMIKNQIIPWGLHDQKIINLIAEIKREDFVPQNYRNFAYADMKIPLGNAACLLTPKEQAIMLQALKIKSSDKVLEIGTGTGYMTAILAKLAKEVISIEIEPTLLKKAAKIIKGLNLSNVTFEEGDGSHGWGDDEKYDCLLYTSPSPRDPE